MQGQTWLAISDRENRSVCEYDDNKIAIGIWFAVSNLSVTCSDVSWVAPWVE